MNLPFVIWILHSFIVPVPRSLEVAARVYGAEAIQVFFKGVWPLIRPGLAASVIFTCGLEGNE